MNAGTQGRKDAAPEQASYDAARLAWRLAHELLDQGVSFCFETVFSHPSKIDFTARAKALGYEVVLVFIHLDDPALNLARICTGFAEATARNRPRKLRNRRRFAGIIEKIAQRVVEGGHTVPEEKVATRIGRTLVNIGQALPIADEVHLLDNSSHEDPFRLVGVLKNGVVEMDGSTAPSWALELLSGTLRE